MPIIKFINQLGGKTDFLVLFIIIVLFLFINALIKNKIIRIISTVVTSVFIVSQTLSLYFTQSFIGYQFYVHANLRGVIGIGGLFINQISILVGFFAILILINLKSYDIVQHIKFINNPIKSMQLTKVFITVILAAIILIQGNLISDTKTLLPLLKSNNINNFKTILRKYNMSDYITPDHIKCSSGNNIIVISMESLEKAFLNGKYASLTPNLNKLKNKWQYIEIKQNIGSSWTSGSLYTYLTGFPAFFGLPGNSIFQTAYNSNITSITHVLKKANYTITYLNGNTDYSGTKEMLNVLKFDKIIDYKNTPKNGFESQYGLRDKDIFRIAKHQIEISEKSKTPFALFISTTDTHFPNGIYDKRMISVISPKNTNLEFTVASLDFLIGDFINFLENRGFTKNTSIYLFPDHLKMGDPSIFMHSGKRCLYCITNSSNINYQNASLYQIDLPKIILNGAHINHNLRFLTDYIKGNKNKYIQNNILQITKINTSGILNTKY